MKLKRPTGIRCKTFDGGMTSFLVVPEPGQIVAAKELDVKNVIAEGENQICVIGLPLKSCTVVYFCNPTNYFRVDAIFNFVFPNLELI